MTDADKLRAAAGWLRYGFRLHNADEVEAIATKLERLHDREWLKTQLLKGHCDGCELSGDECARQRADKFLEALEQPCSIFPQND